MEHVPFDKDAIVWMLHRAAEEAQGSMSHHATERVHGYIAVLRVHGYDVRYLGGGSYIVEYTGIVTAGPRTVINPPKPPISPSRDTYEVFIPKVVIDPTTPTPDAP